MNNEEKIYDLLEKIYVEVQENKKGINNLSNEIDEFRNEANSRFNTLDEKTNDISNKLDDLEANNANRHIIMNSNIEKIKKNMSTVEEVTAKNWTDIIELKKIK